MPGTLADPADLRCYRVAAATGDRLAVDSRDPAKQTRTLVLDAAGEDMGCAGLVSGCSVTGRTSYQVLVFGFAVGSTPYELDMWTVWADGRPPAECAAVPSVAYGFGPYTGMLDRRKPALCLVATRAYRDELNIAVDNPADPDDGYNWDAGLYSVTATAMQSCAIGSAGFQCWFHGRERSEQVVYLLTNGQRLTPHPYRLEAKCAQPLCGGSTFTVAKAAPASVTAGGTRTITLTGTSLHLRDTVQVTPDGRAPITATVTAVSPDRRTLTADVDLTGVPAGRAGVTARSFAGGQEPVTLPGALTVTPPALRATTLPMITGSVKVGVTVKASAGAWTPTATAYAYRWAANGATIAGATKASFKIPGSLAGKKLTVTVTATRSGYPPGTATSKATAAVAKGAPPKATRKPAVTGTAKVGRTVRAAAGTWSPKADGYRYEWRLNGTVIRGAAGATLRLTASMRGKRLTVTVVARKAGYADGRATSGAVTVRR